MVIVNSLKVAEDLLDLHGANFSDRPVIPMGGELAGFRNTLALVQYGDRVRKERRLFHQRFGSQTTLKQFAPLFSSEIKKLLNNIVRNPDAVMGEIRRCVTVFICRRC
jgi:hypothetical protein